MLPERPRLEHMHVIGTTGGGKSKFLECCIKQDIIQGRGVCVIDPHGEHPDSLYRAVIAWLELSGYGGKRVVHLIDPNASSHTVGFNPLSRPDADTDLSVLSGVTLEAFSRAWGGEDTTTKPTIERVLTAAFTALAELNLTLVEAPFLLDRKDRHGLRAYAIETLLDRYARDELRRLHELSLDERRRHDFDLEVVGPMNRLARFLRPPAIRAMVGQSERLLDFRRTFDEGEVILCNLSGGSRVYERDADLLGRLLTRFLFFHAKRRARPERPYFIYLDECHRYLSGDLENILAESRKYGVAAVLAHQWLEQAASESDNMLAAIRNGTNAKVVFRIKDPEEAEALAHAVVPLDLEIPVQALTRPTVVGHRRVDLANASTGTNTSHTTTRGTSVADTEAYSQTVATSDAWSESDGMSSTQTEGESASDGITSGASLGESAADGSSTMVATNTGASTSMGVVTDPTSVTLLPGSMPVVISQNYGTGYSASESLGVGASSTRGRSSAISEAKSSMRSRSSAASLAHSRTLSHSSSVSYAESVARGRTVTRSISEGDTTGESESRGWSEALEPILEDRPSSVHGKDNALYMAAQTLRNLPTGSAFLNYVGRSGMVACLLRVPPVKTNPLTTGAFASLRERLLAVSPAAIPAALAQAQIDERERRFLAFTPPAMDDAVEPEHFRVPARQGAASRGSSRPVGAGRRMSSKDKDQLPLFDEAPLADGGRIRAELAPCQGSRSPEATTRSAALDRDESAPRRARRAANGAKRVSEKV